MDRNYILNIDELDAVFTAAVTAQLFEIDRRSLLLAGVDRGFVGTMPCKDRPADQVWSDLLTLNEAIELPTSGGDPPLACWMKNAVRLAAGRLEAEVFADWRREVLMRQQRPTEPATKTADLRRLRARQRVDLAVSRWHHLRVSDAPAEVVDAAREAMLGAKREARRGGRLNKGYPLGNRYILVALLGTGGFAEVWRAWDRTMSVSVAIKVLHGQFARSEERLERFFRGAEQMSRFEHPGVVKVLTPREEDDGFFYFVMELVDGGNLRAGILSGWLDVAEGVAAVLAVAKALGDAHSAGLVHRDVKPANILLTQSKNAKLTDFDLVKAKDTTGGTRTGGLGTAIFASPETLMNASVAGPPADVYGLGMTLAFVIHGAPLPGSALRHPETLVVGLSIVESIRAVILRAIEFDPAARFSDAGDFSRALAEALNSASRFSATNETSPRRVRTATPAVVADPSPEEIVLAPRAGNWRQLGAMLIVGLLLSLGIFGLSTMLQTNSKPPLLQDRYVLLNVETSDASGRPVPMVRFFINGKKFGITDKMGNFQGKYRAADGEVLAFNVEAPQGYMIPPATDQSTWQIITKYPNSGKLHVDFSATLQRPVRDYLFMVRAGEEGVRVEVNGQYVGSTGVTGDALLRVSGAPGTSFTATAGKASIVGGVFSEDDEIYLLTAKKQGALSN